VNGTGKKTAPAEATRHYTNGTEDGATAATPLGLLFAALAGSCDLATGLLLIASPLRTLSWMGIAAGGTGGGDAVVYLRFIGAFVAGVGASYLYPLVLSALAPVRTQARTQVPAQTRAQAPARARPGRLPAVIEVTALVRAGVALFVTGAVISGALSPPWLSVAGTDAGLAALQLWMLARGMFGRG